GLTVKAEREIPKEVTCKGGLMTKPKDLEMEVSKIAKTFTCIDGVNKLTYKGLNDAQKSKVINYIEEFNNFFIHLNDDFNFSDLFTVSQESLNIFRSEINKHLRDFLEEGLAYNRE